MVLSLCSYICSQELAQLCQCSCAELLFAWNLGEFNLRSSRTARGRCASVGSYVLVYLGRHKRINYYET